MAILLVLADHVELPFLRGGYVGVDIFFVISGFLITSHLLSQIARTGRIAFADFYARRMRRILPAALTVAAVTMLAGLLFMPSLVWVDLAAMAVATAFYVPNMLLAAQGTDYLAGIEPSPFQHYWSLGVEEQFYIVWPLMIFLLWLLLRRSKRRLGIAIVVIVVAGFAVSVVGMGISAPWSFFSLPTRAWELGVGGLVAIALHPSYFAGRIPLGSAVRPVLSFGGLAAIMVAAFWYDSSTSFPGVAAALPVLGAAALILGGSGPRGPVQRLLAVRPALYIGKISYSLYLWHWPLLVIPQAAVGLNHEIPLWVRFVLLLVSVGLADLTFRFVEEPARRVPLLTRARPRRSLVAGVAGSVLVALIAALAIPASASAALATTQIAADADPSDPPVFTSFVPANLSPALADAAASTSEAAREGCHIASTRDTHINDCVFGAAGSDSTAVLIGDSHGGHWFAGVDGWATAEGIELRAYTKAGCSTVLVDILDGTSVDGPCASWKDKVLAQIEASPPDYLIVTNTSTLPFATNGLDRASAWAAGVHRLTQAVPDGVKIVVIGDTPEFDESIPRCLSHRLDDATDCGAPRSTAVDQAWLDSERAAFEADGAGYVDMNDYFCTDSWCGAIVGDVLMYRDATHITETWSAELAGPLGEKLDALVGR